MRKNRRRFSRRRSPISLFQRGGGRRDPSRESVLSTYLHRLNTLDPPNTGNVHIRTGTNVYISYQNIENAFILADALEEAGYEKLAKQLSAFARGVIREMDLDLWERRRYKKTVTVTPSWEKWRSLTRKIRDVIADMREESYQKKTGGSEKKIVWWQARRPGWNFGATNYYLIPSEFIDTEEGDLYVNIRPLLGPRQGRDTNVPFNHVHLSPRKPGAYKPRESGWRLYPGASRYLKAGET